MLIIFNQLLIISNIDNFSVRPCCNYQSFVFLYFFFYYFNSFLKIQHVNDGIRNGIVL